MVFVKNEAVLPRPFQVCDSYLEANNMSIQDSFRSEWWASLLVEIVLVRVVVVRLEPSVPLCWQWLQFQSL